MDQAKAETKLTELLEYFKVYDPDIQKAVRQLVSANITPVQVGVPVQKAIESLQKWQELHK